MFPGGVGQTERQVEAINWYKINGFIGTPDFLKIVMDKADELGTDISCMNKALVGAGALPPCVFSVTHGDRQCEFRIGVVRRPLLFSLCLPVCQWCLQYVRDRGGGI